MKNENVYDCNESFAIGKQGEDVARRWMSNNKNIVKVVDVSHDPKFQHQDIDFIITDVNGKEWTVEVKTDTYTTGRMCYEVQSSKETSSEGCMRKSKADLLLYYFVNWKKLYVFPFNAFRKWCEDNLDTLGIRFNKQTKTKRFDGTTYSTENVYFNLSDVEKNSFCSVYENVN